MLLAVFLFNVTGYYFVQQYLLDQAQKSSAKNIDQNTYNKNQLIELKIPLNMPYYQNTSFDRHEGSITIKGIVYSYVERKIANGYLILKCLPDWKSQQVKENTGDYFAKAMGIEKNGTNKSDNSKAKSKVSFDDFEEHLFQTSIDIAGTENMCFTSTHQSFTPQQLLNRCEQPPEHNG